MSIPHCLCVAILFRASIAVMEQIILGRTVGFLAGSAPSEHISTSCRISTARVSTTSRQLLVAHSRSCCFAFLPWQSEYIKHPGLVLRCVRDRSLSLDISARAVAHCLEFSHGDNNHEPCKKYLRIATINSFCTHNGCRDICVRIVAVAQYQFPSEQYKF